MLEKLAGEHSDEWALVKLDTEAFPHISAQYGIRSIPNVKLFVDGEVIDEFVGALPKPQVVEWLRKAIPSRYRMQLADARRMLSDSGAGPALGDTAADHCGGAGQSRSAGPDSQGPPVHGSGAGGNERGACPAWVAALRRGRGGQGTGRDVRQGRRPRDSAGGPRERALPAGVCDARSGDLEAALEGFIDVVRKDRRYDDDGARRGCVAIFNLLGNDHELTRRFRAALSRALY